MNPNLCYVDSGSSTHMSYKDYRCMIQNIHQNEP